jgi:hypothetical protein
MVATEAIFKGTHANVPRARQSVSRNSLFALRHQSFREAGVARMTYPTCRKTDDESQSETHTTIAVPLSERKRQNFARQSTRENSIERVKRTFSASLRSPSSLSSREGQAIRYPRLGLSDQYQHSLEALKFHSNADGHHGCGARHVPRMSCQGQCLAARVTVIGSVLWLWGLGDESRFVGQ